MNKWLFGGLGLLGIGIIALIVNLTKDDKKNPSKLDQLKEVKLDANGGQQELKEVIKMIEIQQKKAKEQEILLDELTDTILNIVKKKNPNVVIM